MITPAFDRKLAPDSRRPIAVAYSGGGDSLAALVATLAWARRAERPVIALHVDHGLQADSSAWTRQAEATARQLGADFAVLAWTGEKPRRGLAAAARRARHALIAEAARARGAEVVVFGHTADDRLEAELMRAEGSSLGWLREWSPSPVWPEGRGVFLLRPLLGLRRAEIRARLEPLGLAWIEDPANVDPASPRARARLRLGSETLPPLPQDRDIEALAVLAASARADDAGGLAFDRASLVATPPDIARRLLSAALASVGGGEAPPRRERLEALVARLAGTRTWITTLAGVRLEADHDIRLAREAGAYRRHALPGLQLAPGETGVWDGRFEIENRSDAAAQVLPLAGRAARLCKDQRDSLRAWPAALRGGLPAIVGASGEACSPVLGPCRGLLARTLVKTRFWGACGVISQEFRSEVAGAALTRVAE
ncbi:tRNA lysidine(34) synthetase TilS [Phenylobacterium montanum]|uniref:tRNA(Ile)-lysidine synthase n=1 Tax=Phenylobacterium montanum TaxID=2823693 RepID=A0A975G5B4_9CAUL|nr:tRNA lysidine(34) synthetase TilS [Caulobacter sp. S6]